MTQRSNRHTVAVRNRSEALEDGCESKWNTFKQILVTTAKDKISKNEKQARSEWMTIEVLDLMKTK